MLISGSATSSPMRTSSFKSFSSANLPFEFSRRGSFHDMFVARGKCSLSLVLRFSFCDDLFFTIMCPFLPDGITCELLRIKNELRSVRAYQIDYRYCNRF